MNTPQATGLIIMGVSASGKSTVGELLARQLGWDFFDADDFHSPANVAKMAAGIPLDDDDRAPWLAALHDRLAASLAGGRHPVLACSALKGKYRRRLREGIDGVRIVYLKGTYDMIRDRIAARTGHYMKPEMLRSQFEALEEPSEALVLDVAQPPEEIVRQIVKSLQLQ